jgi:hypothetical protein
MWGYVTLGVETRSLNKLTKQLYCYVITSKEHRRMCQVHGAEDDSFRIARDGPSSLSQTVAAMNVAHP